METHAAKAVFLSYASQDAEAARRMAEALRVWGVEVWFDQEGGLEHGDEWDAKIRQQIKECIFFVPIISANTEARLEGYFRLEWDLAAERAMGIAHGVPFILPIVIDDTREATALVPERFRKVQWMRLSGGNVAPETQARFLKLWSQRTGGLPPGAGQVGAETGADRSAGPAPRAAPPDRPTFVVGPAAGARVLGRYVLIREVGRGGMGVVWLARDEELRTDVALKFVHEAIVRDEEALDLLRHETRTARTLSHPHILKVHDFVFGGGHAAISMEFFEARTLKDIKTTQPGRCFAAEQLAPWLRQLCGALDYAHTDARVVHRDLKPANLMVDETGRLKVTDFGIAHRLAEQGSSRLTGRAGFTLSYASPQQLRGSTPTVADDIYALGATLYELLTGEPPFYQGDLFSQVQQLAPAPLTARRAELAVRTAPATLLPPIPPEWEETVLACLAKEPKDRPQSAGEVAARLGLTAESAGSPGRGSALPLAPVAPAADQRGMRWSPKVGQNGSLIQNPKNDPHVQEATPAQS
jgi:serine/threonine protein kinase